MLFEFTCIFTETLIATFTELYQITLPQQYYKPIALFIFLFTLSILVGFYLFKSFAMYKMAKNNKLNHKIYAFLPFFDMFLFCKLINSSGFNLMFFRMKIKNVGIYLSIFMALNFIFSWVYDFYAYFESFFKLINYGVLDIKITNDVFTAICLSISRISSLISLFFMISAIISFNSKFVRSHSIIIIILLIATFALESSYLLFLPSFAIVLYSVRNNPPFDAQEYIRAQNEIYMRSQNNYNNNFNGQYNSNARYNSTYNSTSNYAQKQKFDDPFEEYSNDNNVEKSSLNQDIFSDFSTQENTETKKDLTENKNDNKDNSSNDEDLF